MTRIDKFLRGVSFEGILELSSVCLLDPRANSSESARSPNDSGSCRANVLAKLTTNLLIYTEMDNNGKAIKLPHTPAE